MKSFLAAVLVLCFCGPALAQQPSADSTDAPAAGTRPSDGAIQGGAILPGETGGVPSTRGPVPSADTGVQRCNELLGSLREQCLLKQQRGASTGPGNAPRVEPRAPPPQNPR